MDKIPLHPFWDRAPSALNENNTFARQGRWVLGVVLTCAVVAVAVGYYWYAYYTH